jgi:hypothetical protein
VVFYALIMNPLQIAAEKSPPLLPSSQNLVFLLAHLSDSQSPFVKRFSIAQTAPQTERFLIA